MITHKINKLPKNTVEIMVTIPWLQIQKNQEEAFESLRKELVLAGFRKGNVPASIAHKHISKDKVYRRLIDKLVPKIYQDIIKEEGLKPIISPKIELIATKEDDRWQLKIIVAEKPQVLLGDYKKSILEIKNKDKKNNIWVPGKKDDDKKKDTNQQQIILNKILSALLQVTRCEIADMIVEEELNRRLTQLIDDIQKIGLTVETYLKSKGETMAGLKEKYQREIIDTYKLEFILTEVADKEEIKVEKEDLDKMFLNIKDEKERKIAQGNSYFYASILRKQKTLDFLLAL